MTNPLNAWEIHYSDFGTEAEEIYMSSYSNLELVHEIADTISVRADDARRTAFLAEASDENGAWFFRSTLAKALVLQGETLSKMNRRRA